MTRLIHSYLMLLMMTICSNLLFSSCGAENDETNDAGSQKAYTHIALQTMPRKTVYAIGEPLDIDGLTVRALDRNNQETIVKVDASNVKGFDSSSAKQQLQLTIQLGGATTTFAVDILNLTIKDGTLTNADKEIEELVLPPNVTAIADHVFEQAKIRKITLNEGLREIGHNSFALSAIEEIKFPSTLQTIKEGAFYACKNLKRAEMRHTSLNTLQKAAFQWCSNMTEVSLPTTLKEIGEQAFSYCKGVTHVDLAHTKVEQLGDMAFFACDKLERIDFPRTLRKSGTNVFYYCHALKAADFSNTKVEEIGESAFFYCTGLTELKLPSTLKSIQAQAFCNTTSLTAVKLPENLRTIGNEAFRESGLVELTLPNNLSQTDQRSFYLCKNLRSVRTYGPYSQWNDIENAGIYQASTFAHCPNIETFEIPMGIKIIGQNIVTGNDKLKEVTLTANVERINFNAFANTYGLKRLVVATNKLVKADMSLGAWQGLPSAIQTIVVPRGMGDTYKKADGWKAFAAKIKEQQ